MTFIRVRSHPWASWHLKSPTTALFFQQLILASLKTPSQLHIAGPFVQGIPLWQGISLPKSQWYENIFMSWRHCVYWNTHYSDVTMSVMASQIAGFSSVRSTFYPAADQRKRQSSASLIFSMGIHRWPEYSPQKGPVTRKICPFDDVNMSPYPFYPQADVEGLRSQGIHVIVAGPRDDNPADWQGLVLGDLDLIVGTASVSDMLNFRPFQYNVHDVLSNISGNCQFVFGVGISANNR